MTEVLVIDNCSLINIFRNYYFDRDKTGIIYRDLINFIIEMINNGEIVIIDKVFSEFHDGRDNTEFKKLVKSKVVNTQHALPEVTRLSKDHYIKENERYFGNNPNAIEAELRIEESGADLFLIAYCNQLKSNGVVPILITDETTNINGYKKLIAKIPTICKKEKIRYEPIAKVLFEIYQKRLIFSLKIV